MSDSSSGDLRKAASAEDQGILAGLPRTRPQRASARRTAARTAKPGKRATAPNKAPRARTSRSEPVGESVPMQGYESEDDSLHRPIQPPNGAELVASIAELAGELAKAGANTGGRVLKDFLSHLPG
ncbi:MAG TPA: hypothetical protein VGH60_08980 [Solirubrobacteraceae bacterium]|jgi:hypothetical protein